jgi:hypothetical protein
VTAARRLTREQYAATVRDLLGQVAVGMGADRLPADDASDGLFVSPATLIVSPSWADSALGAAEEIARAAVTKLDTLVPCSAPECNGRRALRRTFFESFGKRAFRRPTHRRRAGRSAGGVPRRQRKRWLQQGHRARPAGHLAAPSFLYRIELGPGPRGRSPDAARLTPYEVASRPVVRPVGHDARRSADARGGRGQAVHAAQVEAQARRLRRSPARRTLVAFVERWFGLELLDEVMKDPARYPQFNEAMITAMRREVTTFVEKVVFDGDGGSRRCCRRPTDFRMPPGRAVRGAAPAAGGKVALPLTSAPGC